MGFLWPRARSRRLLVPAGNAVQARLPQRHEHAADVLVAMIFLVVFSFLATRIDESASRWLPELRRSSGRLRLRPDYGDCRRRERAKASSQSPRPSSSSSSWRTGRDCCRSSTRSARPMTLVTKSSHRSPARSRKTSRSGPTAPTPRARVRRREVREIGRRMVLTKNGARPSISRSEAVKRPAQALDRYVVFLAHELRRIRAATDRSIRRPREPCRRKSGVRRCWVLSRPRARPPTHRACHGATERSERAPCSRARRWARRSAASTSTTARR